MDGINISPLLWTNSLKRKLCLLPSACSFHSQCNQQCNSVKMAIHLEINRQPKLYRKHRCTNDSFDLRPAPFNISWTQPVSSALPTSLSQNSKAKNKTPLHIPSVSQHPFLLACSSCSISNVQRVSLAVVYGRGVVWFHFYMSSSSTLGSSTTDLILRRKVTASRPSMRR